MKKVFLTSVAFLMLASAANSADLAAAPYAKAAPIDPGVNWTGFYIGAMGGYGWSDEVRASLFGVTLTTSSNDLNGGFAGGTVGYNWQPSGSPFVVGFEADAAWSDIKYRETLAGASAEIGLRAMGSVTGRVGYAVNSLLVYAKGGYAWADVRLSANGVGVSISQNNFHSGWTIGGGAEFMIARNWSIKGEYMYVDLQNENYGSTFGGGGIGLGATFHTVKGGINYRF